MHSLIGHEDWIRDIDVCSLNKNQLMIVSSSQDCYIRVWKLSSAEILADSFDSVVLNNDNNIVEDEVVDEDYVEVLKIEEIRLKSTLFRINTDSKGCIEYSMNLESVLYGHDDWVYSVRWQPLTCETNKQELVFVSASIDKTMVVWKYDEANSLWLDIVILFCFEYNKNFFIIFFFTIKLRAGDIGGNTLGFYGATFDLTGEYLVAHGFQGALNAWKRTKYDNLVILSIFFFNFI